MSALEQLFAKKEGDIVGGSHIHHVVHEEVKVLLTDLINLCFGVRLGDISGDELVPRFWDVAIRVREWIILNHVFSSMKILEHWTHKFNRTFSNGEFTPYLQKSVRGGGLHMRRLEKEKRGRSKREGIQKGPSGLT
jgi:hypothetical protein